MSSFFAGALRQKGRAVLTKVDGMEHRGSIEVGNLVDELAETLRCSALVLFAGAGISLAGGIPASSELIHSTLGTILSFSSLPQEYKRLTQEVCTQTMRLEIFLRELVDILGEKGLFPLRILSGGTPSLVHLLIAELMKRRLLRYVVTTNHDLLFEKACATRHVLVSVLVTNDEFKTWKWSEDNPAIFKLHGSADYLNLGGAECVQAEVRQVARGLSKEKSEVLKYLIERYSFLIVGYSGRDFFGALPIVFQSNFNRIVWINHEEKQVPARSNLVVKRWLTAHPRGTYVNADSMALLAAIAEKLDIQVHSHSRCQDSKPVETLKSEGPLLEQSADVLIGMLLKRAGKPDEAYDCLAHALARLDLPAHSGLITKCHIACAEIAGTGLRGWRHEFLAKEHSEAALKAALSGSDHILVMQAQLAVYDSYLSVAIPLGFDYIGLLIFVQHIVDYAMVCGESILASTGCKLLAQVILNCENAREMLPIVIGLYEDAVMFEEDEYAQDVLASTYYWLALMNYTIGAKEKEIKYNLKRLRSLLLIRQMPEHEHVASCLRMIKRTLDELGRESLVGRKAVEYLEELGLKL